MTFLIELRGKNNFYDTIWSYIHFYNIFHCGNSTSFKCGFNFVNIFNQSSSRLIHNVEWILYHFNIHSQYNQFQI